jgi:heme/copper-type cytochrome/quinol oxidase subunit 2
VLAVLFHSLLAVETAAEEGRKVVLTMLAVGGIFVGVIALGEVAHWVAKNRRRQQQLDR